MSAAFPWLDDVPAAHRAAAEWARDQLAPDDLDLLRRLPSERRLWVDDDLVLICHGSPGSQTDGLAADLDPAVTVQRVTRTDARVICCGHTHVAEMRELGRKLIVNPGSCGYASTATPPRAGRCSPCEGDGAIRPTCGAPLRRRSRGRGGGRPRPARRRLPRGHDPHRAVRPMSGPTPPGGAAWSSPAWVP